MAACAKRQALTEKADSDVVSAEAALSRERHLMGPISVDRSFAELAFAVDHSTHRRFGRRPRSPRCQRGRKRCAGVCGRRQTGVPE